MNVTELNHNCTVGQNVEVKTAAGWQKGVVLCKELSQKHGVEVQVELENGHIGKYGPDCVRLPMPVSSDVFDIGEASPPQPYVGPASQPKDNDPVKPHHYTRFVIDPIEYCNKNGIGFCAGNVIKYVSRYDAKGGIEDLDKAEEYLRRMRKHYAEKLGESVPGTR